MDIVNWRTLREEDYNMIIILDLLLYDDLLVAAAYII
jgi:hypothetical protein